MKIPKSSSMILATLAVSSSTPSLAAPTGDASTGAVSSSHISSRRSSVSYPMQDVDGRDCQPNAMLGPVLSMLNGLPMGPDITAVVDKVVSALDGCQSANTAAYEVPPHEQLAQLDVFGRTLSAIAQNALAQQNSTSNSTSSSALSSPSPTTVPPNSPNVTSGSAQPTDSSTVQQRDVLFARRGVAAPPQQAVASQTLALVSAPVAAASNVPRALDEGEDCDDE